MSQAFYIHSILLPNIVVNLIGDQVRLMTEERDPMRPERKNGKDKVQDEKCNRGILSHPSEYTGIGSPG